MTQWKEWKLEHIMFISKDTYKPSDGGDYKYVGLEHIGQGSLRLDGYANSSIVQSNKYHFKIGDVLFGKLRPY